jgi:hypothetical protein
LVVNYGKIDLWVYQENPKSLNWCIHRGSQMRPGISTSTDLPVNAVDLLRLLGMTSDPNAGDVVQLWNDLMNFLPTLGID